MTPRERVLAALAPSQPDFTPCDYFATPEIHDALSRHLGVREDHEIRECLGCDLRYIRLVSEVNLLANKYSCLPL